MYDGVNPKCLGHTELIASVQDLYQKHFMNLKVPLVNRKDRYSVDSM